MKDRHWNKCDTCGRFIAIKDFKRKAIRRLINQDTYFTSEEFETLCKKHSHEPKDTQ